MVRHGSATGPGAMPNGVSVADRCCKHGVSDATVYKWKAKYGGVDVSEGRPCCAIGPSDNGGTAEGAGRRECSPETAPRRCDARQCRTEGSLGKNGVTQDHEPPLVQGYRDTAKRQAVVHPVASHEMGLFRSWTARPKGFYHPAFPALEIFATTSDFPSQ